ncbi:MAG: flavin reductase [Planctomycetes bacterium]|nr:flavin reductase [Planctomycetota bacterium]
MLHVPAGVFVMTAHFEGKRTGVVVRSVQRCAQEPPMICVAIRKGHWISPLIRDSHHFGLCKITGTEKLLIKKFAEPNRPRDGDPFDCMPIERMVSGAPILSRALAVYDCEVARHLDLEADHEIYIGKVLAARVSPGVPDPPPLISE